jgi:hypothetical protein
MTEPIKENSNIVFNAVHYIKDYYVSELKYKANLHNDTVNVGQITDSLKSLSNLRFFTEPIGRKKIEEKFYVWFVHDKTGDSLSTPRDTEIVWKDGIPGIDFSPPDGFVPFSEMTVHIYS